MTIELVVLGTGGSSVDIVDTVRDINAGKAKEVYRVVGFLDDDQTRWGRIIYEVPVLGPLAKAPEMAHCRFVNGIGSPNNFLKKPEIIKSCRLGPDRFVSIVHPTASVSSSARMGAGSVLFQNVTVTSNVTIGDHVIVLPGSVISHDDVIGDYTCIAAGASISGGVSVGKCCYLGANSSIIGNVTVGDECMVGMGAVVIKDLASNSAVVGNPARIIRKNR